MECMWVDIGPTGGIKICGHREHFDRKHEKQFKEEYCRYCLEGQKVNTANRALSNYDELIME